MSEPTDFAAFDPRLLALNERPLQFPGRDELVRTVTVAGPDAPGDRRVFLSTALLEQCLSVARSSLTGRCLLTHAGVRVDLYQDRHGHRYEVWTLVGVGPKPESPPVGLLGG
jgi:hypothetical protein